jgi:hypothetical protein
MRGCSKASASEIDAWEVVTPEQAQERKEEWDAGKKSFTKNYTHGMRRRQTLARAIMLSPDEARAGAWSDDMKKEATEHAITLRRILHHLLGEVVVVKHLGEAQAIPEGGPPAEELNEKELETGDLRADMAEAMDDLQKGMARVNEIHEVNNAAPNPPPDKEKVTIKFDFDEDTLMGEAGVSAAEGETPRASKPRVPRKRETRTWMIGMRTNTRRIFGRKWMRPGASCRRALRTKTPEAIGSARMWKLESW